MFDAIIITIVTSEEKAMGALRQAREKYEILVRRRDETKGKSERFPFENRSESRTCVTVIHLPLVEKARYRSHGERKINLVVITPSWPVSVIFHL